MNITDTTARRRKIGIQLFCEDLDSLTYYDVAFHIETTAEQSFLCLTTESDRLPENSNRAMAIKKIFGAKDVLQTLKQESKDFSNRVHGLEVIVRFVYDHGKWCTLLAQEQDGVVEWVL